MSKANEIEVMSNARPSDEACRLLAERCGLCNGACNRFDVHVLRVEIALLRHEIVTDDQLLADRNRVLAEIPECPAHGDQCLPNASRWIAEARNILRSGNGPE